MTMPEQFGPYRLLRLLGRGGFGEVYSAHDVDKDRTVALKLIAGPYSRDPAFRERMYREANAAGRLHDPHVVPIHTYGEIDGRLYIDMRLIDGTDLAGVLARDGAMPPERAVWIVRQIASALDAAHTAGLVHRDVKPANILLTNDDFGYLVDFGLANAASDTKLTSTGATIGTLAYMAPERFTDPSAVGPAADVYALACVLYECLTGATPYPNTADLPALMGAHLNGAIPAPSSQRPGLPASLDDVIRWGLAKDPADRYATAGELARAAEAALSSPAESIGAPADPGWVAAVTPTQVAQRPAGAVPAAASPGNRTRTKKRALIAAVAIVAVCALAGVAVLWSPWRSEPTQRYQVLPFVGLGYVDGGVAVDETGAVYVADKDNHRVLKLAAGSDTQIELPFDVSEPIGVAVDQSGAVYVSDTYHNEVWKLARGAAAPSAVSIPGITRPTALAAGANGSLYIVDDGTGYSGQGLWRLVPGSVDPERLSLPKDADPAGVAVGRDGAVYVADGHRFGDDENGVVWKLPAGGGDAVQLPFHHLATRYWAGGYAGIAVDQADRVFVANDQAGEILELPAGASEPRSVFKLTGDFKILIGLAVDTNGNLYVGQEYGKQVLKLPPQ
ncbi:MAG: serine/threonine-protein kinase [Mycolicibacterium insubricum]